MTPSKLTLSVCVVTYRRPTDLAALLPMIEEQLGAVDVDAEVLVIDNDPEGSARPICARAAQAVRCVTESQPGIAAARNRGLREAAGRDILIFIDDDERPDPGWLGALLGVYRSTECAGVVGPVVSRFDVEPDPWIVAGGYFDRRRLPTGTVVDVAATNNLLLDLGHLRRTGLSFDERFGLSGGSDTLFTRSLSRSGGRLVWCDEAVVTDVVPAARITRSWALRRRLRIGNSLSRTELALPRPPLARAATRVGLSGRGAVRVVGGLSRMAVGVAARDLRLRATGARTTARGLGIVLGALGYTYVEYRRPVRARGARAR